MKKTVEQLSWGQRVRHPHAMEVIKTEEVLSQIDHLLQHNAFTDTGRKALVS